MTLQAMKHNDYGNATSRSPWSVQAYTITNEDRIDKAHVCLLYTSDAADERSSVDLGGRRIIKKKKIMQTVKGAQIHKQKKQSRNKHT